ncbi:MAG: hypothetical protein JWP87_4070, partial [Labilithrix sp.]|nr:hypothetical protein [Labilithrix sp.]
RRVQPRPEALPHAMRDRRRVRREDQELSARHEVLGALPTSRLRAPEAPPASVAASAKPSGAAPSASTVVAASAIVPSGPPQVSVGRGAVLTCKTSDGESKKGKECGSLAGLDNVVPPHLKKLAQCSAAEGQTGKLSFVATAVFPSGGLSWDVGKSSTVGNVDGITSCLKTHFSGVTATGIAHEHNRYTVAYNVTFAPGLEVAAPKIDKSDKSDKSEAAEKNAKDDKAEKPEAPAAAAGGEASVGWEVALVRDVPKTGGVVARLPRGTKVRLGAIKDGWYAIKFGENFSQDGFVYRGAIGR